MPLEGEPLPGIDVGSYNFICRLPDDIAIMEQANQNYKNIKQSFQTDMSVYLHILYHFYSGKVKQKNDSLSTFSPALPLLRGLSAAGGGLVGIAADADTFAGLAFLMSPLQIVTDSDVWYTEIGAHVAFVGVPFAQ